MGRHHPRRMVVISAAGVTLNVVLNLVLVPGLGDRGTAAAMLLTEVVLAAVVVFLAAREVGGLRWASMVGGPLLAGLAMCFAMLPFDDALVPALPLGAAVYAAALVAVERVVDPGDTQFLVGFLRGRLAFRPGR